MEYYILFGIMIALYLVGWYYLVKQNQKDLKTHRKDTLKHIFNDGHIDQETLENGLNMIENETKKPFWSETQRYFFVSLFVIASVVMGYFGIDGYGWFIFLAILSFFGPISVSL